MAAFIYWGIFAGFYSATDKFWASIGWPLYLGELIGKEALKREMFK